LASTGLYTTVVTAATAAWNASYVLRVVKDGTAVRLYYNNVLIGTGTCDASITGTNHGVFSTYTGNTFDNFTLWARGSGGEYTTGIPDQDLTATRDTTVHYSGTSSLKVSSWEQTIIPTQKVLLCQIPKLTT